MPENMQQDPFEDRFAAALRDTGHSLHTDDPAALVAGAGCADAGPSCCAAPPCWGSRRCRPGRGGRCAAPAGRLVRPRRASAAASSASPGASSAGTSSSSSAGPASGDGAFSGDDILRSLKALLPEGTFSEEAAQGTDSPLPPNAHVVFDDGEGAAAIGLSLGRVEPGSEQARQVTTCPDKTQVDHDGCSSDRLPDGSLLMLFQGYEYPDRRVETKWWNAELVTPRDSTCR